MYYMIAVRIALPYLVLMCQCLVKVNFHKIELFYSFPSLWPFTATVCFPAALQWPRAGSMLMGWICTTSRQAEGNTLCCCFPVLWVNTTTRLLNGSEDLSCTHSVPDILVSSTAGSTQTDFGPQLKSLNKERFTVVGWDPRGYGQSRPPDRDFPSDFFERDAKDAVDLMKVC